MTQITNQQLLKEQTQIIKRLERELQIEESLERVRKQAIAMDNSNQMEEMVTVIHQEMQALGLPSANCYIYLLNESSINFWMSIFVKDQFVQSHFLIDWQALPVLVQNYERWKRGDKNSVYDFNGKEEVEQWYKALELHSNGIFQQPPEVPDYQQNIEVFSCFGGIGIVNYKALEVADRLPILTRFGNSFEQVYTRFSDLQKAETQTREAQIEAALERVRSTALAMHHSSELVQTVNAILEQITILGVNIHAVHIYEFIDELRDFNIWASAPGQNYAMKLRCPPFKHVLFERWQQAFDKKEDFFLIKTGKAEKNRFFKHFFKNSAHDIPNERQQLILNTPCLILAMTIQANTGLAFLRYTEDPLSPEDTAIMQKLAIVFEQGYTRFLDLKKAEALKKEVFQQASLDRVRAEISSMRTTKDLQRITPLLWQELKALEVPFFRCGVFITNDTDKNAQVMLTTPEGKNQVSMIFPYGSSDLVDIALKHWRQRKIYTAEWNKEQFLAWMNSMGKQGLENHTKNYFGLNAPPENLALHFVPFIQGVLYIGNDQPLKEKDLALVQSLGNAFSVAYARYEDFKQIEITLKELQSTQTQLIQAEKMASLGELTAGIAHEIQNPLNFVNNFAEVSNELLEELQEELAAGNTEDVKELITMLTQNLEKINHHGGRASSIVKGMLDHSRTSSNKKELTDLNSLCEEFLKLAYHGLRAKDKSFNAAYETNFDAALPKLEVVPQDIGRVILNLINNAFYVVKKKGKEGIEGYEPKVVVTTKRKIDSIEISVSDNGKGIPKDIIDKIFQPFFTTKPTGQGTGLGLSLSYDIVTKGHGGELTVDTSEGVGTSFLIELPIG